MTQTAKSVDERAVLHRCTREVSAAALITLAVVGAVCALALFGVVAIHGGG